MMEVVGGRWSSRDDDDVDGLRTVQYEGKLPLSRLEPTLV